MIDRSRLIKLMMMTTSTNDSEALIAIRKANAMLKVNGLDWNSFLGTSTKKIEVPKKPKPRPMGRGTFPPTSRFTDPKIPGMISSLLRDTKGSFRDFLSDIQDKWFDKGYLTEAQYEAIVNAYERAK